MDNIKKCIKELNDWSKNRKSFTTYSPYAPPFYIKKHIDEIYFSYHAIKFDKDITIEGRLLDHYLLEHITPILMKYDIMAFNTYSKNLDTRKYIQYLKNSYILI